MMWNGKIWKIWYIETNPSLSKRVEYVFSQSVSVDQHYYYTLFHAFDSKMINMNGKRRYISASFALMNSLVWNPHEHIIANQVQ